MNVAVAQPPVAGRLRPAGSTPMHQRASARPGMRQAPGGRSCPQPSRPWPRRARPGRQRRSACRRRRRGPTGSRSRTQAGRRPTGSTTRGTDDYRGPSPARPPCLSHEPTLPTRPSANSPCQPRFEWRAGVQLKAGLHRPGFRETFRGRIGLHHLGSPRGWLPLDQPKDMTYAARAPSIETQTRRFSAASRSLMQDARGRKPFCSAAIQLQPVCERVGTSIDRSGNRLSHPDDLTGVRATTGRVQQHTRSTPPWSSRYSIDPGG